MSTTILLGTATLFLAAGTATAPPANANPRLSTNAAVCANNACVVTLACDGREPLTTGAAPDGTFTFTDVPVGTCTLTASGVTVDPATAPREAASGMATGRRAPAPASYQVNLTSMPASASVARTERKSISVVFRERQRELRGHVTLIK